MSRGRERSMRQRVARMKGGIPTGGAGTIATVGNLKEMIPDCLVGASYMGYGVSLFVGIGISIPILNEEMAQFTAVRDENIVTNIYDYGMEYPKGGALKSLGTVNYAQLRSGEITVNGQKIHAAPLSSYVKAKEIANILKEWMERGDFLLGEPQRTLPSV